MFDNIKKKDLLYRNKKLLLKIWDNLKNENEKNEDEVNENEFLRQFINNDITKLAFEKVFVSEFEKIIQDRCIIIDIGCGAMTWFYDVFYKLKEKEYKMIIPLIIGIDKIDPTYNLDILSSKVLLDYNKSNYSIKDFINEFIILDIYDVNLHGLLYEKNRIDFIYQRDMITVYNNEQWDLIINNMFNVLKNNGIIELIEYDINIKNNSLQKNKDKISDILNKSLINIFKNNNIEININEIHKKVINRFGYENVKIVKKKLPLYDENIFNKLVLENMKIGYQYFKDPFMKILKIEGIISESFTDFDRIIEQVIKEWDENRSYMEIYCIYAKKLK